ncbi:TetR/AcrR family transcriptional regulator [Rugosimonospora africana]|uniref:TetR family transcriptional regulator n=1 Tax=Rugosimonospora africana TaxID=556532 RepID=A0A8J3QPV8_9ACTN|nr:TetR/AcrR family transcriptional regulator [Rugosimonospora africana]GIH14296.1 TetR family transcriptional regulator [Rugosimonospora africana]
MTAEQTESTRRRYRSPRREQQAAQTRAAVLAAAGELFARQGFAKTGMRDIAGAAGVAVETLYAGFRSKGELLKQSLDAAIVGDAEAVPLAERPEFAALRSGTRDERIAAAARLMTAIHGRTAGLHLALREAGASDADLAGHVREEEDRRRTDIGRAASLVAGRALTQREHDGLWAVLAVEVYQLLTGHAGWSARQYEEWVADVIDRMLEA